MRLKTYLNESTTLNEIKILLTELSLDQAIEFAQDMHQGQIRKGNKKPYVGHPKAVYHILKSFKINDKLMLIAAWLHDTIEDTSATYNIIKKKFNKELADIVKNLSSDPKEIQSQGKAEYLLNKMLKMNNNTLTIKLADRLHNTTDIQTMPPDKSKKTKEQTLYIIQNLKEKRNLNQIQKKIIKSILKNLDKV